MSDIAATIAERQSTHGDFDRVAYCAQSIKATLIDAAPLDLPNVFRESLDMIAVKMARIACGDPAFAEHWHDIEGYARLAKERCK